MAHDLASVVIPNYNGRHWLPRLLESLVAQTEQRFQVIVVDDASRDESVRYLSREWPAVRVITSARNAGFATTCNHGLRASDTPFVILLNNDTHVDPHWLAEGLAPFQQPDVGSVASLTLLAEPPHAIDTAGDLYSVAGGAVKRNHLHPAATAAQISPPCFAASGVSAFYRREALTRVGGLDERFESYYEDVDLGFRLTWAGYRCVMAHDSICYHHLSSSYNPGGWRYHFNSSRNSEIVWWTNLSPAMRRRHLRAHLAFLGLQALNKLRQGYLLPYLAGKWAALREREHIHRKRKAIRHFATASEEVVEDRLVRDWWSLHVSEHRRGQPGGKADA